MVDAHVGLSGRRRARVRGLQMGKGMAQRLLTVPGALAAAPACAFVLALALAGGAQAQSSGSGSQFNAGYGGAGSQMATPINVSRAYDASGNHVVVDGVTQTGSDESVFYAMHTNGAGDSYSGAGALGGVAIGNNLQVSVVGSNNTVVVNSTQTNNAPVTATTVLNGQVNLDGNGN